MAKQCLYCGQPLEKEDARFCNECGRAQGSPAGATAGPVPIRVKLPPKEFSSAANPFVQPERSRPNQAQPGTARTPQRAQPASPPSRLPKRPVRPTVQESADLKEIPGKAEDAPVIPARPTSSAGTKTTPPAPSTEDVSTMVLPGWREELEQLRKEQVGTSTPVKPTKQSAASAEATPALPQHSQSTRPQPRELPAPPKTPQADIFSRPLQSGHEREEDTHLPEQPRRELRVKVWEQEPTMQFPNVSIEKGQPGPIPAIEHTPFASAAFGLLEEEAEQIAQVETIHWETFSPAPAPIQERQELAPKKESKQPLEEQKQQPARETLSARNDIEDQPTAHMAVPDAVKQPPSITIERTSTPAPTAWTSPLTEEVENQPTRPMSPIPSSSSQVSQNREQPEGRSASPTAMSNPASFPGFAGQQMNAPQAPDAAFGMPGARGQAANPHAQPGQTFDPASLPPLPLNPASTPGSMSTRVGMQNTQQRSSDTFGQRPTSFAPPSTPWPATLPASASAEEAKPRKKKRGSGKRVLLLLALLVIVGGIGSLVYYQSSSGGAINQPYQSFQNNTLGVAFNYPQGWHMTVNQAQTSAHFADSSQTGQITISTAATNGQQLTQYLAQASAQLGMANTQTKPTLTFAGASWQEVQSNVTQKGVSDTLVLYVTEHNNHFYALAFQAPATAYAQMEQVNFKPLRDSFSFL